MKYTLLALIFGCALSLSGQDSTSIRIGKKVFLESKILGEKRPIFISTPPYYVGSGDTYPILLLLDGESHFAHISTMVDNMGLNLIIPQLIVVAIPNTDRIRDLTPLHSITGLLGQVDSTMFLTSGGGDKFLHFLSDELVPYVEKNYRTQPHRILMGHSLGGQFVTYAWQEAPSTFQSIISISGAYYGRNKNTLRTVPHFLRQNPGLKGRIVVAIGDEPLLKSGVDSLMLFLKKSPPSLKWAYRKYLNDDHGSVVHPAIHDALRFIFPDWYTNTNDSKHIPNYEDIEKVFRKHSLDYGYEIKPSEQTMVAIGFLHLELKAYDPAIDIFQQNVKNFPSSATGYFCLGLSYNSKQDKRLALQAFEKALELNPDDRSAKHMIEQLKGK